MTLLVQPLVLLPRLENDYWSLQTAVGGKMLEVPAAIVAQQGHLPGPSPLPVQPRVEDSRHGSVRVIPAGKAPGHCCVRVNLLQAKKGPPKPKTSLTASDDDIDLIAKEVDARAKAQLAAEADEEWRIWIITNPNAYARFRAGAAMAIWILA
ncbi:hypothetical protein RUND412_002695 [Rhizina undulata]